MQKLWNYVSNLGTTFEDNPLNRRIIVISNQLNYVMFLSMLFLLLTTIITLILTNDFMSFGTLRIGVLLLVSLFNLVLSRYGYVHISRFSLIFLPPVVFLLGPTLIGYVEQESYTYYPYVLICVSIIPQLLIYPKKERLLWWLSMVYYLLLVIFIDKVMVRFSSTSFPIVDIINTFYPFYKIAQIGLFLFINASVYYLRLLNFRYEEELKNKNIMLDNQNSELKVRQEEIERQKDELVRKEINTWQKLVKIISHEILNSAIPITNLAGMTAQMLEDDSGAVLKPEKIGAESAEDIHHSLKVIETRTHGLINFVTATKSLTDIPKPNIRRILIKDLFERIAILYKPKFTERGVRFETNIIPPDLSLEADMELIEQVLINLIKNALEAMREESDPELLLTASHKETDHLQISVSDNGEGISRDVIERIFLPFYSTRENNSGIGLSLSQQIMMLHNGRLDVSTENKKGATFTMVF
jgi:signal transduction histidine kinase